MLVIMKLHATENEIDAVCRKIESMGFKLAVEVNNSKAA